MTLGIVGHSFTVFVTAPGEIYRIPRLLPQKGVNYAQPCPDSRESCHMAAAPPGTVYRRPSKAE